MNISLKNNRIKTPLLHITAEAEFFVIKACDNTADVFVSVIGFEIARGARSPTYHNKSGLFDLFNSDRFRKVLRLVNVAVSRFCNIVAEKLKRNDLERRHKQFLS